MPAPRLEDAQDAIGEELTLPEFACLDPDAELYKLAVLQPVGVLDAGPDYVRAADRELQIEKHRRFLRLAAESFAKLVVTPEYSCPWEVLEHALQEGPLPDEDALWVLGCEGISPDNLAAVQARNTAVAWRGASGILDGNGFIDPLCYVFLACDDSGNHKLVVLIQAKTTSMADMLYHFERNHLIRGDTVLVFNNCREDRIRLLTLLCSDSLGFAAEGVCSTALTAPYLVLHSQLCLDPFHEAFKNYRSQDFLFNREKREFLALNWASGFQVPGYQASDYGGSAFYTKSSTVNNTEARINELHVGGLYYGRNGDYRKVHIYFLNYGERAIVMRSTKAFQGGVPAALQGNGRTGPQDAISYIWDDGDWIDGGFVDDGLHQLCASAGANEALLSAMDPVNRERFLSLTAGFVRGEKNELVSPERVRSLLVDDGECAQRIGVCLDPRNRAEAERKLALFRTLETEILLDPASFPECIQGLHGNCRLEYPIADTDWECNLGSNTALPATVAYIGDASTQQAERIAERIGKAISVDRRTRVVVWFRHGGHYASFTFPSSRIDEPTRLRSSIT